MKTNLRRTMKLFITTVIVMSFILTSVTPAFAAAKAPKFKTTTATVAVGKTVFLEVLNKVSKSTYKWSTSDKTVATVTNKGTVKGIKAGTATITCKATTPAKKVYTLKAKVTVTAAAAAGAGAGAASKAVLSEDFSKSVGPFIGRGGAIVEQVAKEGNDGKPGYMFVSGRTAAWNGATTDVTSIVKVGKTYTVTGWVKYTGGKDKETFKITQQKTDSSAAASWPQISGDVEVEKGKWTMLTGTLTIEEGTAACEVYFECSSNDTLEFMADSFTIVAD